MKPTFLPILFLTLLFSACLDKEKILANREMTHRNPKRVILMIGDGMGLTQISSGLYNSNAPLSFERFKDIGLIKTSSASHDITDSAAGATAFAAGKKTYNHAIAVDIDTLAVPTILEMAEKMGIPTGIVVTSSITHATPASFFAHVAHRKMEEEIALALLPSGIDFFVGSGTRWFNQRKDSLNLMDSLTTRGYFLSLEKLPTATELKGRNLACLIGYDGMKRVMDGRDDILSKATTLLSTELGKKSNRFFLLVEGSQIDWGGHDNNAEYIITELLDFDKAIGAALDFAQADGETLVIVTADHETGGFALSGKDGKYNKVDYTFTTGDHTGTMVPVFAFGPGSEQFRGIYENTAIFDKLKKLMELK